MLHCYYNRVQCILIISMYEKSTLTVRILMLLLKSNLSWHWTGNKRRGYEVEQAVAILVLNQDLSKFELQHAAC